MMMTPRLAVPIPERMQRLPRDHRGLPIPVIVIRDREGKPHFAINDTATVLRMVRDDRCHICGEKLLRGRWFVGGPLSAFHPHGRYQDGPIHAECMRYAMQVCPYLSAPNWVKSTMTDARMPEGVIGIDHSVLPDRPRLFVAVMARGAKLLRAEVDGDICFMTHKPYIAREYWRHGEQIDIEAAAGFIGEALRGGPQIERQEKRVLFRRKKPARRPEPASG